MRGLNYYEFSISAFRERLYMENKFKLSHYTYTLPPQLIAQRPSEKRTDARLLILHRKTGKIEHSQFNLLNQYLSSNDTLVLNNTKVIPARLIGCNTITGREVEILLLQPIEEGIWEVLARPARRVRVGDELIFDHSLIGKVIAYELGKRIVKFIYKGDFGDILDKVGKIPLPPYIKRELLPEDKEWYQTVYAHKSGAIAAPTAGLHFSPEIINTLIERGINCLYVTLHVGMASFRSINVEDIRDYKIPREYGEIHKDVWDCIFKTKGRVVVCGTSTVRLLESAAAIKEHGWTDLFIYPDYKFNVVDAIITNFHLPNTTLFLLVSAFAGRDYILTAYEEAIKEKYRFASYGDCMLIV